MREISRKKKWVMEELRWGLKLEELEQTQVRKIGALKTKIPMSGLREKKIEKGAKLTLVRRLYTKVSNLKRIKCKGLSSLSSLFSLLSSLPSFPHLIIPPFDGST